jgi:trans-2,3-dihydro-3-hydroxyanthranilate isomerase
MSLSLVGLPSRSEKPYGRHRTLRHDRHDLGMEHRIAWLDVFAERPLAGNGLAVVDDADGVSDETMLALAQEMGLSETTFVQSTSADGADYRNRIWDPHEELPFAGHPSLGTAVAVARWRGLDEAGFVQETIAGLQPIEVRKENGGWRASMLQNAAEFGPELDRDAVMTAVGLRAEDSHPDLPPQVVSTGMPHVIAPVAERDSLARALPDYPTIYELSEAHGSIVIYLASIDPDGEAVRARSFTRTVEMGEDPATGSAAGPLGAYLNQRNGTERLVIRQGEEMGRPSLLEVEMADGRPRVSGGVAPLIDGEVSLP